MKLRSVRYLSAEGVKNMWVNRLMSVASVGVLVACMVLIGMAYLISGNANKALGSLEQQNVVMAYFNDLNSVLYGSAADDYQQDVSDTVSSEDMDEQSDDTQNEFGIPSSAYLIHNEEEALALCDRLAKIDNVLSVEYISSEDGLESIKSSLLEGKEQYFTFLDGEYGNPLSGAAKITLNDMSKFSETVRAIEGTQGVDSVQSQSDLADKINALKSGLAIAGIWIVSILLIISLVIVANTIRVTMYNRKLEIGIMKAVGATNSFIRLPFVIEGVVIGLISSALSMVILYFCYRVATETIKASFGMMELVHFSSVMWEIFIIFVCIGVLSGVFGSLVMISKYLRKEGSEFTAI